MMSMAARGQEEPYALNFPTDLTTSYAGRAITGITLTGDDGQTGSITQLATTTPRPVYQDCTAQSITLGAGALVTSAIQAQYNSWMHAYLYVDWNRDSTFQTTADELVSYTCYGQKNSAGQSVAWGVNLSSLPQFTVPADADGTYRARMVIDWDCIDPGGRYGSKYTDNFIDVNGGAVIDFHLQVVEREKIPLLTIDTRHGSVYDNNGAPLPHSLKGVSKVVFKPVPVGTGYELDGSIVVTTDTATYTMDRLPINGYAIPVCGDMTIKAYFRPTSKAQWVCTFDDEFDQPDGSGPDLTKWKYCTRENPTWKRYVSQNPKDSVCVVRGGMMSLLCKPNPAKTGDADAMLSGALETSGNYAFTYGRVEIRAKVMPHKGNFPALWMMPMDTRGGWPDCGEVDIFEQIDNESRAYHTIHSRWGNTLGHSGDPQKGGSVAIDIERFHTYALEWDANQLRWYVDGKQTFTYSRASIHDNEADGQWPFKKDFYLIINQSVGNGSWAAPADYTHTYQMLVDWVRVYQDATQLDASSPAAAEKPTATYDLSGRKREGRLTPGIYVVDGKKKLVAG